MPRFRCPKCGREVISEANLEGNPARCAKCGRLVKAWPAPIYKTRKPSGRIRFASCSEIATGLVVLLVIIILLSIASRR